MSTEAFDLAARFLVDVGGRPEPWPTLFSGWAEERGLSPESRRQVRVQIIRQRVFHAVEGRGGDAA